MGIRQQQISRAVEKIVKTYLQRGKYPTLQTITYHFAQWLREQTPGTPSFSPISIRRKAKTDADQYNEHVSAIHQDISDAYTAAVGQNQKIMSDFSFGDTERSKITHELSGVSKKIDQLLLLSGRASGYVDTFIERFADLSGIDKANTNAAISLNQRQVTLQENSRTTSKVLLSKASGKFEALTPNVKTEAVQSMNLAFDDNLNSAWWHVVKTESPGVVRAQLTIRLAQDESINEIQFLAHHGKPVIMSVEYSMDGTSFSSLPGKNNKKTVTDQETWSFPNISAKSIRFVFEKKEHDDQSAGVYSYYFGAKNISLAKKAYITESVLVTTPIQFESTSINMVSLLAGHEIPNSTNINYEVALKQSNQSIGDLIWYPISSQEDTQPKFSKVVEFHMLQKKFVEYGKSEPSGQIINGMQVFRLLKSDNSSTLPDAFDQMKEPVLLRGINQWRREHTYLSFDGSVPLNAVWRDMEVNNPQSIYTDYLPIGNALDLRRSSGATSNAFRFTTCIQSDEAKTVPVSIAILNMVQGIQKRMGTYSLYINGKRMVPTNEDVSMTFRAGWNEIQILLHLGDMQMRRDQPAVELPNEVMLGKFNLALEKLVRADLLPLRIVDAHTLYHNVSPNDHSSFAVHESQIALNYLSKDCIFQFTYQIEDETLFSNEIVLRATLQRIEDNSFLTPKITSLEIQAK